MGSGLRALQDTPDDVPGRCSQAHHEKMRKSLCANALGDDKWDWQAWSTPEGRELTLGSCES